MKTFNKLLSARINNKDEQTLLDQKINTEVNELLINQIEGKAYPPHALSLIKLGACFSSCDKDYEHLIVNIRFRLRFEPIFSITAHLDNLIIRLLASPTSPSDLIHEQLLPLKSTIHLRIKKFDYGGTSTASYVRFLEATLDQTNALGKLMHSKQGLLESKTVKKIYEEINEYQQKFPSISTSKMQMWSPAKQISGKQADKLSEIEEKMYDCAL